MLGNKGFYSIVSIYLYDEFAENQLLKMEFENFPSATFSAVGDEKIIGTGIICVVVMN